MPVYAYGCKDCGHAFDIRQSFSDSALSECPECGGTLRKKFNTVGVVFKGSGFYRTDSRSGEGKASKGADAGAPGTSSGESGKTAASPAPSDGGSASSASSTSPSKAAAESKA